MKPKKTIYQDQNDVLKKALKRVSYLIAKKKCIKKAYVWGSLARKDFGLYEKKWKDHGGCIHEGSDIDVVIVVNEKYPIPKSWKNIKVQSPWCDVYEIGEFKYQKHKHVIDGLLFFPSKHSKAEMLKTIRGKIKYIKLKNIN